MWTPPPVQPVVQSSSPRSAMSFAAIQLAQAQQDVPPSKTDRRSLVQIQEEERARQVEEDFLRWWAAEEERLKAEELAAAAALLAGPPKKPKRPKAPKGTGKAVSGGESQKGGAKDASPAKQRQDPSRAPGQGQGQVQPQSPGLGQGKSRKRKPAQASSRDDVRKLDAQAQARA